MKKCTNSGVNIWSISGTLKRGNSFTPKFTAYSHFLCFPSTFTGNPTLKAAEWRTYLEKSAMMWPTWYISTTMIGSSASTLRDKDPRGMIVCWRQKQSEKHEDDGYEWTMEKAGDSPHPPTARNITCTVAVCKQNMKEVRIRELDVTTRLEFCFGFF